MQSFFRMLLFSFRAGDHPSTRQIQNILDAIAIRALDAGVPGGAD